MTDYPVMIDPVSGRIALFCPDSVITFCNVEEFRSWLVHLLDKLPGLSKSMHQANAPLEMESDYAREAIDEWENQILQGFEDSAEIPTEDHGDRPKE